MTKEIAIRDANTAVIKNDFQNGIFLNMQALEQAQMVAKVLSKCSMIPDNYKGNEGNCLIALEMAGVWDISPMRVMQNVYVIKGKPGIEAQLAIALINRSGKFSPLKFTFEGKGDDLTCYCSAIRKEDKEECKQGFSLGAAKRAGWWGKTGSLWPSIPRQMLHYRAASFFARIYCPDILFGMQTVDEIRDSDTDVEIVEEAQKIDDLNAKFVETEGLDSLADKIMGFLAKDNVVMDKVITGLGIKEIDSIEKAEKILDAYYSAKDGFGV